jgi:hypothetical protein
MRLKPQKPMDPLMHTPPDCCQEDDPGRRDGDGNCGAPAPLWGTGSSWENAALGRASGFCRKCSGGEVRLPCPAVTASADQFQPGIAIPFSGDPELCRRFVGGKVQELGRPAEVEEDFDLTRLRHLDDAEGQGTVG